MKRVPELNYLPVHVHYDIIILFNFMVKGVGALYDKDGHIMGSGIANRQVRTVEKCYNFYLRYIY
jgi:hypothetical protein